MTDVITITETDEETVATVETDIVTIVELGHGHGGGGAESIDDLTDVDTSSSPPADGESLTWDDTLGQWIPGPGGGGSGTVQSVSTDGGSVKIDNTDAANPIIDNTDLDTALAALNNADAANASAISTETTNRTNADATHAALTTTAHGGIVASTDPRLTDSRTPSGAAGGDLTGTFPNPTIGTGKVTSTHIADGTIVNGDINAAAAIAYAKLTLTASLVNGDVAPAAAIAYSKLALTGSIVNADVGASAAIALSKLATIADQRFVANRSGGTAVPAEVTPAQAWAMLSGQAAADVSMGSHKLTSVTDPGSAQDAATKNYVDVNFFPTSSVVDLATLGAVPTLASVVAIDGSNLTGLAPVPSDRDLGGTSPSAIKVPNQSDVFKAVFQGRTFNIPVSNAYTLVAADAYKWVAQFLTGNGTLTIPPDSSVNFATDTLIIVSGATSGGNTLTITAGVGVTLAGSPVLTDTGEIVFLRKQAANNWLIFRVGLSKAQTDAYYVRRLPTPTNGYIPVADSGGTNGITWSQATSVHSETHADTSFTSSSAENTLASHTLTGGVVAAGDLVRCHFFGELVNNTGSGQTYTFRFKIGSTTVTTFVMTVGTNANHRFFHLTFDVLMPTTATQRSYGAADVSGAGSGAAVDATTAQPTSRGYNTASEDTSSNKTILLSCQMADGTANSSVTLRGSTVELVKKR